MLVTGASRGIGAEVARQFAADGARVAVHYRRSHDSAEEVLSSLEGDGHGIVQADLADRAALEPFVRETVELLEGVDVLVNNAGIYREHPLPEVDLSDWMRAWDLTIDVNLFAPAHLSYLVARRMMSSGGGKIVNVSSRGAFRGEPEAPAYGASKAALNALSQSLARALAPHGILVYAVAPGWVDTDMAAPYLASDAEDDLRDQSPLGRVARPEEVARTVLFLAGEGTDYLTGCIVDVNGASYLRS